MYIVSVSVMMELLKQGHYKLQSTFIDTHLSHDSMVQSNPKLFISLATVLHRCSEPLEDWILFPYVCNKSNGEL